MISAFAAVLKGFLLITAGPVGIYSWIAALVITGARLLRPANSAVRFEITLFEYGLYPTAIGCTLLVALAMLLPTSWVATSIGALLGITAGVIAFRFRW